MDESLFAQIRVGSAEVMRFARAVRIDEGRLAGFASELASVLKPSEPLDPAHHRLADRDSTLAFVMTLDAINFGSGYFPFLAKHDGLSGYLSLATALKQKFVSEGPWTAEQLAGLDVADCARTLGQDTRIPEVLELMTLFRRALNQFGRFLVADYAGRFEAVVDAAGGSAARLVEILSSMPFYRDVSAYRGFSVPFYKRAQITASDLATVFGAQGWGAFRDIDELTLFADNLVPHVLRCEGVLLYTRELGGRIDAGELLEPGSEPEVEIRAGAVHAVECCVAKLRAEGLDVSARQLDTILWTRGQRPEFKARPRHRTRCVYY